MERARGSWVGEATVGMLVAASLAWSGCATDPPQTPRNGTDGSGDGGATDTGTDSRSLDGHTEDGRDGEPDIRDVRPRRDGLETGPDADSDGGAPETRDGGDGGDVVPDACGADCFSGRRTHLGLFGAEGDEMARGVALTGSGNRYVVGSTDEALGGDEYAGGNADAFVAKFDASWSVQWTRMVGTLGTDRAHGVAVGPGGAVYVTGLVDDDVGDQTAVGYEDAFLARYDATGERQWIRLFGSDSDDVGHAVGVDEDGTVHVVGAAGDDVGSNSHHGGTDDAFLARFDGDGNRQDFQLLGTDGDDVARDLAIGPDGALHVAGVTDEGLGGRPEKGLGSDGFVARYSPSGSRKWIRLVGTSDDDELLAVAATADRVYAGGVTSGEFDDPPAGRLDDGFVAALEPSADGASADQVWVRTVASSDDDAVRGLAVDASGRIHAVGQIEAAVASQPEVAGLADGFYANYRPSGERARFRAIRTDGEDVARSVAVSGGAASVVGQAGDAIDDGAFGGGRFDAFVAEYR